MDLTKNFPRSPKDKLAGVVMLARATDKARAYKQATLGEYRYECPLDKAVFGFLGITDAEEYANKASTQSDGQLEAWVRQNFAAKKSAAEIEQFNRGFLEDMKPAPGSESEEYFLETRQKLDPSRTDITTWTELLDLEEGRSVPRKAAT